MAYKPTYHELEQRIEELENETEKRIRTEEVLVFERMQLLSIFDCIDDGAYVSDIDTHEILYVSQSMKNAFQKELIGGVCYREFQGRDSPCEFCTNEIILKKDPEPYRWKHHNSVLDRDYAIVDRIIRWPDGRNVRLEIAIDITERIKAKKEMQNVASIVEHCSELVNLATLDGKMIFINEAGSKMLGIDPDKVEETNIMEIIPDGFQDKVQKELLPTIMEQHIWEGDLQYRHIKTGELTDVHAMTFPIQDTTTGKPLYIANVSLDISERNRTQEIMIQTEWINLLGGHAAGMANEMNNSLAGIIQNAQVLKNRMSHNLQNNKQIAEECGTTIESIEAYINRRGIFSMIDLIMGSGKRAAKIVDNMLSFSRKSDAHFAQHHLGEVLDKAVELSESNYNLKKGFDFRNVKIIREYDADMPKVMCEENSLQQVFFNILKNGAQAMTENRGPRADAGGQITEEASREKLQFILRVMQEDGMARIEIENNGPGMDEETRKRVFEPFFTTKGVCIGSGLGLSGSYFIITENHGGAMEVASVPGKGTKFIIRLPIKRNVQ